jgi:hypothetical protein
MYVLPIGHYNIILGMPWITAQDARINGPRLEMRIRVTGTVVRSQEAFFNIQTDTPKALQVSATSYEYLRTKGKTGSIKVFIASIADINRAL